MSAQKTSKTPAAKRATKSAGKAAGPAVTELKEHIVEIISDSGEGAQRCGQSLGSIAARMGNGIWTTEIIPAEIRPPARSVAGASGNRIRIGSGYVTNGGDQTDLVVAFNEQVLLGRVRARELKPDCIILLESMWRTHNDINIAMTYKETYSRLVEAGYQVREVPMEQECLKLTPDAKRGKNMFALGMLCYLYSFDLQAARDQIALTFGKKAQSIIDANVVLLEAGHKWASENFDYRFCIPSDAGQGRADCHQRQHRAGARRHGPRAWNSARCTPITPATSASHYLSDVFEKVGGLVHQAEDEIAACAFAVGASYASKCTVTITSGPGYSLKQEAIGLAVMAEIPLVVVNVQRGGPSTGQPTKSEQGDLMTAIYGKPRRCAEGRHGAGNDRGVLLFDDHRAQDRRILQHRRRRAHGRHARHLAATLRPPAIQRSLAGAAHRPERRPRRRQALRLGRDDRHRPPLHPRPTRRHATPSPASRTTVRATSPMTLTSTRKACARAA